VANTDIEKQECTVYWKKKGGAWQSLGITDAGNDFDIEPNIESVFAKEKGKTPIGHRAGGESVRLIVSFKEINAETLFATYPFANVTGSGASFDVKGRHRIAGESLASCCGSIKLDPILESDKSGIFIAKCINKSNVKLIMQHDKEKLLTCIFDAEFDDTQASGEELYRMNYDAEANITGWS